MAEFLNIILGTYCLLVFVLLIGWIVVRRQVMPPRQAQGPSVSLIVALRNEEHNLEELVRNLEGIAYAQDKFEVILINDHSDDRTLSKLTALTKDRHSIRVLDLPPSITGKKGALQYGISHAKFEIIATTDGDCQFSKHWLSCIASYYNDGATKMVVGGVKLTGENSFFSRLQKTEFISLVGTTAATIGLGHPVMCNGANLSFRKEIFHEVKGYEDNLNVASGDDEFLMRKIFARYPTGIRFLNYYEAVVSSRVQLTAAALFNQRLRWAGKWKHNSDPLTKLLAVFVLIAQVAFLTVIARNFITLDSGITFLILKIFFDGIFLAWVGRFLDRTFDVIAFFALQILHPLYVIGVGVSSLLLSYSWKERNYKQ